MSVSEKLAFENYALDIAKRELRRGGEPVALEPQVFDLLVYVIRNRDRVVSKDDLVEAVWGGRIVSDSTLTTRINAMRKALGDSGEKQRLIRTVARKGIRFVGAVIEGATAEPTVAEFAPGPPALTLPDKPSIAVLPFQNMSGDPEQEYFADGMVEEIITALSRFHWFFVIARNSTFTYKDRAVDVKRVAQDLGVRYVLEGSVRKAGQTVRITGQLIDAATGAHLWADRFDGDVANVFELQDKVAINVVIAIEPRLKAAEIERAKRKPTENLDAYDLYLRSLTPFYAVTRESMAESLQLLYRAMDKAPHFPVAIARAALIYPWRSTQGWMTSRQDEAKEAIRLARLAIELDRDDPDAMYMAGAVLVFYATDVDIGLSLIDRSIEMNGNCAHAWMYSGRSRAYVGDHEAAIDHLTRAQRLSPRDPSMRSMLVMKAFAHMFEERFEKAIEYASHSLGEHRRISAPYRVLAACYAHLGQMAKAQEAARQVLELDPDYSIAAVASTGFAAFQNPKAGVYIDGMRKAGIPD